MTEPIRCELSMTHRDVKPALYSVNLLHHPVDVFKFSCEPCLRYFLERHLVNIIERIREEANHE